MLGTAGSVSELFLRQTRAGLPLTVTDGGMVRYWITMAHAATLAAHAALLAPEGTLLATAAEPATLTVGDLAERIWRESGRGGTPETDVIGIRPGETMGEILVGPASRSARSASRGSPPSRARLPTAAPAWVLERLGDATPRDEARSVWLEALSRPGLLAPAPR